MSSFGNGKRDLPEEVLKACKLLEGDEVQYWQTMMPQSEKDLQCYCVVQSCGPFALPCFWPHALMLGVPCYCCISSAIAAKTEQAKNTYWVVTTEHFIMVRLDSPQTYLGACCCVPCGLGTITGPVLNSTGTDKNKIKLEMLLDANEDNKGKNLLASCLPELTSMSVKTMGGTFQMIGIDNDFGFCDKLMNSKQARQLQLQAMGAAAMSSAMTGTMPMQPGIAGGMMIPAQQQLNMMGGSSPVQPVMTSVVPPGGAPAANAITDRLSDLHH